MKSVHKQIFALILAMFLLFPSVSMSMAKKEATVTRFAGRDRYETSVITSRESVKTSKKVVVASGHAFPDTLSGGNLVNAWGAPILLTGKDHLPSSVKDEIKRLGATDIYLLGGNNTVTTNVEQELSKLGTVHRIAGADRYDTSQKVVDLLPKKPLGIASGENFADALAATAFMDGRGHLLLVSPNRTSIGETPSYVFGGKASVPGFPNVPRFAGKDRIDTAAQIAKKSGKNHFIIVSPHDYPDALSAAIVAHTKNAAIVLNDNGKGATTKVAYQTDDPAFSVVGGTASVPDVAAESIWNNLKVEEQYVIEIKDAPGLDPSKIFGDDEKDNPDDEAVIEEEDNKPSTGEQAFRIEPVDLNPTVPKGQRLRYYDYIKVYDTKTGEELRFGDYRMNLAETRFDAEGDYTKTVEVRYKGDTDTFTITFHVEEVDFYPNTTPWAEVYTGETYKTSDFIRVINNLTGKQIPANEVTFEPETLSFSTSDVGKVRKEFKITHKGKTVTAKASFQVLGERPTIDNLTWTKRYNAEKKHTSANDNEIYLVNPLRNTLNVVYGAKAEPESELTAAADKLARKYAETGNLREVKQRERFGQYRVLYMTYKTNEATEMEMPLYALRNALRCNYDFKNAKHFGTAVYENSQDRYFGVVVFYDNEVSDDLKTTETVPLCREGWKKVGNVEVAEVSDKVYDIFHEAYRDVAFGDKKHPELRGIRYFPYIAERNTKLSKYARENAKENAVRGGLQHSSHNAWESIGHIDPTHDVGIKMDAAILVYHNPNMANPENAEYIAFGGYARKRPSGRHIIYMSVFGK